MEFEKLSKEEIERRIGTDTMEPLACALTGQPVQGRHSIGYAIKDTAIRYRVLAKHHHLWTQPARDAFEAQVTPKVTKKSELPKEGDK